MKKVILGIVVLLAAMNISAQWGTPFSNGFEEKLSVEKFNSTSESTYNNVMTIINTDVNAVQGDNKLFFSLGSFSRWQSDASLVTYYRPLLNINTLINKDIDEPIIRKAKLIGNGTMVGFIVYLNDTAHDLKVSEVLQQCSEYYILKVLMGWTKQTNNRTGTPIDAITLFISLQEGETNRVIAVKYGTVVYEQVNLMFAYYYHNKNGYIIRNFDNLTIKELLNMPPEK